ncbi:hypothetical protein DIPPA_07559 [Diplonema papillatum]|nr:hypothetical protein DIPPA_07559 [Diplonema papillatum]|eukprot:gene23032-35294_t
MEAKRRVLAQLMEANERVLGGKGVSRWLAFEKGRMSHSARRRHPGAVETWRQVRVEEGIEVLAALMTELPQAETSDQLQVAALACTATPEAAAVIASRALRRVPPWVDTIRHVRDACDFSVSSARGAHAVLHAVHNTHSLTDGFCHKLVRHLESNHVHWSPHQLARASVAFRSQNFEPGLSLVDPLIAQRQSALSARMATNMSRDVSLSIILRRGFTGEPAEVVMRALFKHCSNARVCDEGVWSAAEEHFAACGFITYSRDNLSRLRALYTANRRRGPVLQRLQETLKRREQAADFLIGL